jgi:hypothetical protein
MEKKIIILKITNDRIFYNENDSISIKCTDIPYNDLLFRNNIDIYWSVEIIEYQRDTELLSVEIKDYNTQNLAGFNLQKPKKPITIIHFNKFDWKYLDRLLIYYQKSKFLGLLYNTDYKPSAKDHVVPVRKVRTNIEDLLSPPPPDYTTQFAEQKLNSKQLDTILTTPDNVIPSQVLPEKLSKFEFSVYFTEAKFGLGTVSIKKHVIDFDLVVEFIIGNDHIIPEFDLVKPWFAKVLKNKKFFVKATILSQGSRILNIQAFSPQIDKINQELIDSIKYQRMISIPKIPSSALPDKSLFTTDEIFGQLDDNNLKGNIFNQSEQEILNSLNKIGKVRNIKQIEFLSGKMQSEKHRLLFTLKPDFGYLFYIEGKLNNHFVWELLNSHATYVWSIDKTKGDLEFQYKRIENTINLIRSNRREYYKRAYRNNQLDSDIVFKCIEHENIGSKFNESFPKWIHKLNEQLI